MATRNLEELERFLTKHGVDMADRAFELELNSYGWCVVRERTTKREVQLEIECWVECDESIPRSLKIVSDNGHHDRDVALMRALERVLEFDFARQQPAS